MFCGKLFCHLQQTVKGLLFFRLFDQLCKERTEHIGAVVPQRNCNFIDAVVQFLDSIIGGLGFRKQVGQVADEGIGGIIVDDLVGFLDDFLVIFGGSYRPFLPIYHGKKCGLSEKWQKAGGRWVIFLWYPLAILRFLF